ncbi:MAG TPA: murein biosynthesis integral membrane protein MurJ [Longimicrobiales bacterium]|nr:murein biosynthesis integral membrane protein MurJ [Longimicrobiales bacterium]
MNEPTEPAEPTGAAADPAPKSGNVISSAQLVAAGILLSRIAGLLRDIVFARYLGTSPYASAFRGALRMPNVLQNLLGEGTLSASFIPVYSKLLEEGREEDAGRLAGAIFALLLAVAGGLSLFGVLMAPVLVSVFLPGFEGEIRQLTIQLTRIIFPMTGILVLSAWALGILNSHRKFFVSYTAPVLWNAAMIGALVIFGGRLDQRGLAVALAWGALIGGGLQFLVQVPWVLRAERSLRPRWDLRSHGASTVIRNAGPAIMGRGVVQLSGWADLVLASLLFDGAVAALSYAQTFYMLPVSLFGMSIAAAELPELSRQSRGAGTEEPLRRRVSAGLRQMAVFVVPSAVGYLLLGDIILGAVFERGDFDRADTLLVWFILGGYAVGLLASTATRLYASTLYALGDTRTPARIAVLRVTTSALLGAALMTTLEPISVRGFTFGGWQAITVLGNPIGAAGLALGAGVAAWLEWILLRRALGRRIGDASAAGVLLKLIIAALVAGAVGRGIAVALPGLPNVLLALAVLAPFGVVYFALAHVLGVAEVSTALARIGSRFGGGRRT